MSIYTAVVIVICDGCEKELSDVDSCAIDFWVKANKWESSGGGRHYCPTCAAEQPTDTKS